MTRSLAKSRCSLPTFPYPVKIMVAPLFGSYGPMRALLTSLSHWDFLEVLFSGINVTGIWLSVVAATTFFVRCVHQLKGL